ncbi:MAG: hypothetical protein C0436_04510 [Alphaproteobacteria bacterium]|nr:hypothetical protein [Alphaproteobacteria bacterium]
MRSLIVACALMFSLPAHAASWVVDTTKSRLGFTGLQGEDTFKGEFKRFTVTLDFDAAALDTSRIEVVIPTESITVEGKDREEAIREKDWFDVAHFPEARFISTRITRADANSFIAEGTLTIKGISKPISLPFSMLTNNNETTAHTSVSLTRGDFALGTGEYESDEWIKPVVQVYAMVVASPKEGDALTLTGHAGAATPAADAPAPAAPQASPAADTAPADEQPAATRKPWWKFWQR